MKSSLRIVTGFKQGWTFLFLLLFAVSAWAATPSITSSTTASGITGTNLNYTITASNTPTSYAATGLPDGLTLDSATGAIIGAATVTGTFSVSLSATNTSGTGTATLSLTITAAPTTLPVTSGLTAWYEADSGVTASGGIVTQWNDQTTNAYNVVQSPGDNAPGLDTDLVSGKPVLTFDGNQYLYLANDATLSANDCTIFTVSSTVDAENTGTSIIVGNALSDAGRAVYDDNGYQAYADGTNVGDGGALPNNGALNVATMTFSQSTGVASFYSQGAANGTATISSETLNDGLTIGSLLYYGPYLAWNGNIAEVIVYNRVLTTTERQEVESYLANKYNAYVSGASWISNYSSGNRSLINSNSWSQAEFLAYLAETYPVPSITSSTTATSLAGSSFSYTPTASNSPTFYEATGLPSGLSINSSTGAITGTPITAGTYTVTIYAFNANGTGQFTLTITVDPTIPVISSPTTAGGTVGRSFAYTITAGSQATSFNATGLPDGLSVNTSTGVISGNPEATGTSTITLSATNINGTGHATLLLTVYPDLPVTSGLTAWFNAQVGVTASGTAVTQWNDQTGSFDLTQNADGTAPTFGADPVTGLPVLQFSGSQWIANASTLSAVNDVTIITVASTPNPSSSEALVDIGTGYYNTSTRGLAYSNGYESFVNGEPDGGPSFNIGTLAQQTTNLTINTVTYSNTASLASFYSNGVAAGTASVSADTVSAGLEVGSFDDYDSYYGWTGNVAEVIVYHRVLTSTERHEVEDYLAAKYSIPPVIDSALVAQGVTGSSFSYTITASDSPTSFSATGLPAGLSVNTSSGAISGTPSATGVYYVTIGATNAGGTNTATLILTIYAPVAPTVTSPTTAAAIAGQPFTYTITGSNGPTSYNASSLPSGLSVNTTTGVISGSIGSTGTSTITLSAINSYGTGTATLTLTTYPTLPVTSGLAAWYNANVGITSGAGGVTQWSDESGNGYDVVQSAGPNAPTLGTDAPSGSPVVSFNGNQYLTLGADATLSGVNDITIITVSSTANSGNSGTSVIVGNALSDSGRAVFDDNGYQAYDDGSNIGDGGPMPNNGLLNVNTMTYCQSSGLASFYTQGAANGTASVGSESLNDGLTIGSLLYYGPYIAWDGNIAEVIVYDHVLNSTDRQAVETYLANKYGCYTPNASWISGYSSDVQDEINRNQWNKNQADAYVAMQAANPSMLTTGLKMWLKADAGVVTSGNKVTAWSDQTGNYTVTQSTGANQPTFVASESIGGAGVHFSGNQWLFNPASVGVGMNQDSTIITVAATPSPQTDQYLVYLGNQSGFSCRSLAYLGSSQAFDASSYDSVMGAAAAASTWTVDAASLDSDGVSVSFYQNGQASGSGTLPNPVDPITPGISVGSFNNGGQPFTGDISEVLVYDHQLSSDELQQVSLYLAGKYGLYYPSASWISSYSSDVQTEINRNQWNETQANNYVAMQTANPDMVTSGLKLWLKADSGVSTGIGSFVTHWTDQTGNYPLSQSNHLAQPTLIPSDCNGEPGLRFSGSQSLTNPSSLGVGIDGDMTVITVGMSTIPSTSEYSFYLGNGTTGGTRALGYNSLAQYFDTTGSTGTGGQAPPQKLFGADAATLNSALTSITFYRNGTATGTATLSGLGAVNAGISVGNSWQGDICEVLVYDHKLSSTDLQNVSLYLAEKYGLYYSGASWISSYSSGVQTLINANGWTKAQADGYVAASATLPVANGLTAWFKADSGVVSNASGQVTAWRDSSWNSNDVIQGALTSAPTLATDPATGKPMIAFNGSQFLSNGNTFPNVNDATIIVMASTPSPTSLNYSTLVAYGNGNDIYAEGTVRGLAYNGGHQCYWDGSFYFSNGGTVDNTTNLTCSAISYSSSTGTVSFYKNGSANGTVSASTVSFTQGFAIGSGNYLGNSEDWTGNISEVLIFNRALNATEIGDIETYLSTKYSQYPVAAPVISPNGGDISTSTSISISGATSPNVIRYTLDGTAPTSSSTEYTGTFTLLNDGELVTCAVFNGSTQVSPPSTAQFWIGDTYHIGISDAWQTEYFGTVADLDPNALVPGGSGLTYLQAYQWGYNPTMYSTNGDGLSDSVNHQLGYSATDTDINGYTDANGNPMTNAQQLALGLDPFDTGVNPAQPTPPTPDPGDHTPPSITLTQPSNATLLP